MDWQYIANALFGIVGIMLGVLYKSLQDTIKEMNQDATELTQKVNDIEKLVVGKYVSHEELKEYMSEIKEGLGKIFDKLDKKVDK